MLAASERDLAEREVEHGVTAEPVEAERGAAIDRQSRMLVAAVVETEPGLETREGVDRVRPDDDLSELLGHRHRLRDGGVGGREAPAPRLGEPPELEQLRERSGPVDGDVDFGGGTTLRLRAAERHAAEPSRRPHLSHGTALLEVVAGTGRLEGASGWITSNYLLSDTGDLTDTHLGLLFVQRS